MLEGSRQRGFTLSELIMVIAMIGIIASYSLTRLNQGRERARDAIREGDMKSLSLAVENYFSENFKFPDDLSDVAHYYTDSILPSDPLPERAYHYEKITSPKGYCLGAMMETEVEENDTECGLGDVSGINYQLQGP